MRIIDRAEYEKYKQMDVVDRIVFLNNRSLLDRVKLLADISEFEEQERNNQ